jgi:hypothetical protein
MLRKIGGRLLSDMVIKTMNCSRQLQCGNNPAMSHHGSLLPQRTDVHHMIFEEAEEYDMKRVELHEQL